MRRPWFKCYPSDFLGGMAVLDAIERNVYVTLIFMMYEAGGPLRGDMKGLAAACRVPVKQFEKALRRLFLIGKLESMENGSILNKRVLSEIDAANAICGKLQDNSRKGNAKRWGNAKHINGGGVANGMDGGSQGDTGAMPLRSQGDPISESDNRIPPTPTGGRAESLLAELMAIVGRLGMAKPQHAMDVWPLLKKVDEGHSIESILVKARANADFLRDRASVPWRYLASMLKAEDIAGQPQDKPSKPVRWDLEIKVARSSYAWSSLRGPPPGKPGCLVPPELITDEILDEARKWEILV